MSSYKNLADGQKTKTSNKYSLKLVSLIGNGTFGKVYLCEYNNEPCALKKIQYSEEDDAIKSVLTEFNILTKYRHPRIVKFISFFNTVSSWNFIFEYMEFGSFRTMLNLYKKEKQIMPQEYLSSFFMDIVFGLKYLHQRNITHRDLKPENILVDKKYRLKIADFGISSILENSSVMNQTCIGTITYMAPEVYLQQPYTISCDVWALGIILYEMAMLSYPFTNAERARIINPRLVFYQPKITCASRGYDEIIQQICDIMIVREPEMRATIKEISCLSFFRLLRHELASEELKFLIKEMRK